MRKSPCLLIAANSIPTDCKAANKAHQERHTSFRSMESIRAQQSFPENAVAKSRWVARYESRLPAEAAGARSQTIYVANRQALLKSKSTRPYRTCGKPRSTLLAPGSGQRLVTTFDRV